MHRNRDLWRAGARNQTLAGREDTARNGALILAPSCTMRSLYVEGNGNFGYAARNARSHY